MTRSRFWAATGTAVAAAVGLTAFLFTPAQSGRAMAATILNNLREAAHRGFRVHMSNVQVEDIRINCRVEVLFPEPVSLPQLFGDEAGKTPDAEAFFVEAQVVAGDSDPDIAGLDVEVAMASRPDDVWAYLKLNHLPDKIVEEEPWIEGIVGMFSGGLLVDLKGLEGFISRQIGDATDADAENPSEAGSLTMGVSGSAATPGAADESDNDDADDNTEAQNQQAFNAAAVISAALAGGDVKSADLHVHLGDNAPRTGREGLQVALDEAGADKPLAEAITGVLTGTLRREQIPALVTSIEEAARTVVVEEIAAGRWRLTARDFKTDDFDADELALLGQAVLTVDYRDALGVTRAELARLGSANGRITFEFTDAIDPQLANSKRYTDVGIRKLDLAGLLKSFGVDLDAAALQRN